MRRSVLGGALVSLVLLTSVATAWACVSGPTAFLTPSTAQPGQQVKISGVYFNKEEPINVRFNALDGPILGTFTPAQGARPFGLEMEGTVTIPPGTKPGSYVLILTQQDPAGKIVQTPSRLLLTVSGPGGATPALGAPLGVGETDRPASIVRNDDDVLSGGAMLLIGLGTAGLGMMAAGLATTLAGRRRSGAGAPVTAPVRK